MAIYSVVKFDSVKDVRWLVYKFAGTDFNSKSVLIVGPGQVAIAVHGGKIETVFEAGTYRLDTENLPFLRGVVKKFFGGATPYTMEVYFVNKTIKLDMLWGSNEPIQVVDPKYNVKVHVRCRGQFGIRLTNYQFFFEHLLGTLLESNYVTFEVIQSYFRGVINTKATKAISNKIVTDKISILDISTMLEDISNGLKADLAPEFAKFGFEVINFFVESISVPDEDLARINDFLNKKAEFDIMGDARYRTARGYDVLEGAATNENGAGGVGAGIGVGLGVGLGAAKSIGGEGGGIIPSGSTDEKPKAEVIKCPKCGHELAKGAKFCPECGASLINLCPKCGHPLAAGAKFCPECGAKIDGVTEVK